MSVCTDGCPSMQGKSTGFVALSVPKKSKCGNCALYDPQRSTRGQSFAKDLHAVMIQVSQVVNFIKSWPLQNRLFFQLCKAMDSELECLLYHIEVH